jgi:hypothetical protein
MSVGSRQSRMRTRPALYGWYALLICAATAAFFVIGSRRPSPDPLSLRLPPDRASTRSSIF